MPESRRAFADRLIWHLGSLRFLFFRRSLWKSLRRWREEKLISKLLITYPGLPAGSRCPECGAEISL